MNILKSVSLFLLTGLCEIGGGYLVWLTLRGGKPIGYALMGFLVLAIYGMIPTFQESNFGRTYASYGGFFILMSLFWAWKVDDFKPDHYDVIGVSIAIAGVCIMYFTPRN